MGSPVSAGGLGSGYADFFATVVDSMVQRDQDMFGKPLIRKEMETNTMISSYGTLKGALSEFQQALYNIMDPNTFNNKSVSSSDVTKLTASATSALSNGVHSVEIIKIAKAQVLATDGYSDHDNTSVGGGTLDFTSTSGGAFSVSFATGDDNLDHIVSLINNDTDNTFVTASVQKIDDPLNSGQYLYRLVLTGQSTGSDNAFTVVATEDPSGSGLNSFNSMHLTAAQNAEIQLDGGQLTESTNTFSDAIKGLTMTVIPPSDESTLPYTLTLTVSTNTGASATAIQNFMSSYNKFVETVSTLGRVAPPALDNSETDASGPLSRSSLILEIETSLRDFDLVQKLGDAGIGLASQSNADLPSLTKMSNKDGSSVLNKLLSTDIQTVITLFTDSADGIGVKLNRMVKSALIDSDTVVKDDLNPKLKKVKEQEEVLNRRLQDLKDRLRNQFIKLDMRLTQMNATKQSLSQWTNSLKSK